MEEIKLNGNTIGFADKTEDVAKFMPNGSLSDVRMLGGTNRELTYGDDKYLIEKSNKKAGTHVGDICTICSRGVLQNQGGCAVCSTCQAALKCGL